MVKAENLQYEGVFDIRNLKNNTLLILILSISSAGIYYIQIVLFQNQQDTYFYFFQDLAFIPIQVLVVTLLFNKLIKIIGNYQNKKKINVIISAFFSELGTSIVYELSKFNENLAELCSIVNMTEDNRNLNDTKKKVKDFDFKIHVTADQLESLAQILVSKKSFMIGMLENSSLMEHDSFTDMLWSVFHLADEFQSRDNLKNLSQVDLNHLANDILRAYRLITIEWVSYMRYLKEEYPYLYDLALRKNPFKRLI